MNGPRTNVRSASSAFNGCNNPEGGKSSSSRYEVAVGTDPRSLLPAPRITCHRRTVHRQPGKRHATACASMRERMPKFARHSRTKRYRLCISCASRAIVVQIGGVLGPSRHFSTAVNHFVTTANSAFKLCSRLWLCRSRCWRAEAEATAPSSPAPAPGCWWTPVSPAANFCGA